MKKRLILFFLTVALFLAIKMPVLAANDNTITVTVERFVLGGDFIIEPTIVKFKEGDSYADILEKILKEHNIGRDAKSSKYGYYLQGIKGVDCGSKNIPQCVKNILTDMKLKVSANNKKGLYEFSYTTASGWMYYINNEYAPLGMGNMFPQGGEVVRYMFTLSYGADLTGTLHGSMTSNGKDKFYYSTADKSKLIKYMAKINQDKARWEAIDGFADAYDYANEVMAKMNAVTWEVRQALYDLQDYEEKLPALPDSIELNIEQLNVDMGDTKKLSCTLSPAGTATTIHWSSDNNSVATVKDGVVTGIGKGTTNIHAKTINGLDVSCSVTVKEEPAATAFKAGSPVVSVKALSGTSVQVNWKDYANTDKYIIYRKTSGSDWKQLATVKNKLTYTDNTVKAGTTYYYTVKAQSSKWKITISSKYVTNVKIDTAKKAFEIGTPSASVKALTYNSVKISWKAYKNATGYEVYRKTASGSWKKLKNVTGTSYTDNTALTGTSYNYKIRAKSTKWSGTTYSKYSASKKATTKLGQVALKSVSAGKKLATVKWSKVSGATGYKIYRATSKNGNYNYIKTVKNNVSSYKNQKLTKGKTYYYKVRAYRTVNKKTVYGAYSKVKSVKVK